MDDQRARAEAALKAATRRYSTRAKALEQAEAERDDAIRAARAHLTKPRIAQLTGLSQARVYQIFRHARI